MTTEQIDEILEQTQGLRKNKIYHRKMVIEHTESREEMIRGLL